MRFSAGASPAGVPPAVLPRLPARPRGDGVPRARWWSYVRVRPQDPEVTPIGSAQARQVDGGLQAGLPHRTVGVRTRRGSGGSPGAASPVGVLIGSHVPPTDPLGTAAAEGADVVQIFLGDPQSWKKPPPRDDAEQLKASDLPIYVHAPYIINLASPNNRVRIPSRKVLQQACDAAAEIGAEAVIVTAATSPGDLPHRLVSAWAQGLGSIEPLRDSLENPAGGARQARPSPPSAAVGHIATRASASASTLSAWAAEALVARSIASSASPGASTLCLQLLQGLRRLGPRLHAKFSPHLDPDLLSRLAPLLPGHLRDLPTIAARRTPSSKGHAGPEAVRSGPRARLCRRYGSPTPLLESMSSGPARHCLRPYVPYRPASRRRPLRTAPGDGPGGVAPGVGQPRAAAVAGGRVAVLAHRVRKVGVKAPPHSRRAGPLDDLPSSISRDCRRRDRRQPVAITMGGRHAWSSARWLAPRSVSSWLGPRPYDVAGP